MTESNLKGWAVKASSSKPSQGMNVGKNPHKASDKKIRKQFATKINFCL